MGNTVATNADSATRLDISRVYDLSPFQAGLLTDATQMLGTFPTPDLVRSVLGTPLQKTYIISLSTLTSRAGATKPDAVAELIHGYRWSSDRGQWTRHSLSKLVQVVYIFSNHVTIPGLVDDLYEFKMEEILDKNPDNFSYWQQLSSEISVLPYDSIVEKKYGSEGVKILKQAFAASPYPDQYDQAVQAGINMKWTQRAIQRRITLVKLSAAHMGRPKYMERAGLAYKKYIQDQRDNRILNVTTLRIRPPTEWRTVMQYGIFRIDVATNVKEWESRLKKHGKELAAVGLSSWEQYIQAQTFWESRVLKADPRLLRYLPAQRFSQVTFPDFVNNWKRLLMYRKWTEPAQKSAHEVGYPCLSQPNAFFPYTSAELGSKTCASVTSLDVPYAIAISSFKDINNFQVTRPLPGWATASVDERVWLLWTKYYRGSQYIPAAVVELIQTLKKGSPSFPTQMQDAINEEVGLQLVRRVLQKQPDYVRKVYPAVLRGTLFPTKDRLDYILSTCDGVRQFQGQLTVLQTDEYRQWLTSLLLTVDTVEDGCELVKEAFFPLLAKYKTDNFSKYVQLLDISGVDISDENLMRARYEALSAEQKSKLTAVDNTESGLRWLRQLTTPADYSTLSPMDKWRTIIQLGLATEIVSEAEIAANYNELQVSEIQALVQTNSLDDGIQWAQDIGLGKKPVIQNAPTVPDKKEPKTKPSCRLTSKGKCQWYLNGQKIHYSSLLELGYHDVTLHEIKQKTLFSQPKTRTSNIPEYSNGQWYYLGEAVSVQQLHKIGFSDARLKEIQSKK